MKSLAYEIQELFEEYLKEGLSKYNAVAAVAKDIGYARNTVWRILENENLI
jgi:hypothetical protein